MTENQNYVLNLGINVS